MRRELPWRVSADPYRVLVSEFMLQQTRVETVIPYYQRWLARFPDVDTLASATVDDVLKQWEGLGYYSRARNLHRAAQLVRDAHRSEIPSAYSALRALPGVGDYTAAAVTSIAFAAPQAAVDGNVRRVLFRVLDLKAGAPRELQAYAQQLLDPARPGDFNQAMMELGATICAPRTPSCVSCPVRRSCHAHRQGTVHLRPPARPRKTIPEENANTLVAVDGEQVLVVQRPARGLLAGLWEFPVVDDASAFIYLGTISHTFTHKRIHYRVYRTEARVAVAGRWIDIPSLESLALSTAQRRVAKLALPVFGS